MLIFGNTFLFEYLEGRNPHPKKSKFEWWPRPDDEVTLIKNSYCSKVAVCGHYVECENWWISNLQTLLCPQSVRWTQTARLNAISASNTTHYLIRACFDKYLMSHQIQGISGELNESIFLSLFSIVWIPPNVRGALLTQFRIVSGSLRRVYGFNIL